MQDHQGFWLCWGSLLNLAGIAANIQREKPEGYLLFRKQKKWNREKENKVSVYRNTLQIWTSDKALAWCHLTPVDVLTIKTEFKQCP